MQIKQSTAFKVGIVLVDTNGAAVTGVTTPTVYIQKQAGSSTVRSLAGGDWTEIDATHFPGVYDFLLATGDTDTVGFLKISIVSATSIVVFAQYEIVANIESDTYGRIGAPVGASISVDIASVKTSVGAVTGAVGSVTGAVGSVASGGIAAAAFAADAISAAALSTAAANKVRDTILSDSTPFPGANIVLPTGAVVFDAGNTSATFKTNRTESADDYWKDALIVFTSGALVGQVRKIDSYTGATKFISTPSGHAFTAAPSASDAFLLINK